MKIGAWRTVIWRGVTNAQADLMREVTIKRRVGGT